MSLDDASYPLLWKLSEQTSTPPEFFLAIMASESGLRPCIQSGAQACGQPGKADYWGLNQIRGSFLRGRGIDPQDYLTWSASRQLSEVIIGDFSAAVNTVTQWVGHPPQSPGVLYAINYCSAPMQKEGDGRDVVLSSKGDAYGGDPRCSYAQNSSLDFNKDDRITIGDLDDLLCARIINTPWFQGELKKLYAVMPAGKSATTLCTGGGAPAGGGTAAWKWVVGIAAAGAIGWAGWKLRHRLGRRWIS